MSDSYLFESAGVVILAIIFLYVILNRVFDVIEWLYRPRQKKPHDSGG